MNTSPEDNKTAKPGWWKQRTLLEIWLIPICATLLIAAIVLSILLVRDTAPLVTVWGTVAEWAGVVVTIFGFVGAIGALTLQRRSFDIQADQHMEAVREKEALEVAETAKKAESAKQERERFAKSVAFLVDADFKSNSTGLAYKQGLQLIFSVSANAIRNAALRDVRLNVPTVPDMDISVDRTSASELAHGNVTSVAWKAESPRGKTTRFRGPTMQRDASTWLEKNASVDFTDPNGVRWRKYCGGKLAELPPQSGGKQATQQM